MLKKKNKQSKSTEYCNTVMEACIKYGGGTNGGVHSL